MNEEGIFRISGPNDEVIQLKEKWETGARSADPHLGN